MSIQKLPTIGWLLWRSLLTFRRKPPAQIWAEYGSTSVQFNDVKVDLKRLKKYRQLFQGLRAEIPLSYFYLLAQRAHLFVCTSNNYPYPILGMVHCSNELVNHHPADVDQPFELKTDIISSEVDARQNIRLTFAVEFFQNNILVSTCSSEYLIKSRKLKVKTFNTKKEQHNGSKNDYQLHHKDRQQYNASYGRRYARVSGDYNPIHLYPFTAKLFGFKQPILHGMCLAALAQQSIEQEQHQSVKSMHITFKYPVMLPGFVEILGDSNGQFLILKKTAGKRSHAVISYQLE